MDNIKPILMFIVILFTLLGGRGLSIPISFENNYEIIKKQNNDNAILTRDDRTVILQNILE